MTLFELSEKIKSGEITVDYSNLFCDRKNPQEYLLNYLDVVIKNDNEKLAAHYDKIYKNPKTAFAASFYDESKQHLDYLEINGVLTRNMMTFDNLTLHSSVLAQDLYFSLNWNTLSFKSIRVVNNKIESYHPIIDEDIYKPIVTQISLPSKHILFANYFGLAKENPYYLEHQFTDFQLSSVLGVKQLSKFMADELNVAYGQMDNTVMSIHANDKEVLITPTDLIDYKDDFPEDYKELRAYLKANKFKCKGSISLDVWRWEAIDFNQFTIPSEEDEINLGPKHISKYVWFPLEGDKVEITHYMNTPDFELGKRSEKLKPGQEPLKPYNKLIHSHIKVVE